MFIISYIKSKFIFLAKSHSWLVKKEVSSGSPFYDAKQKDKSGDVLTSLLTNCSLFVLMVISQVGSSIPHTFTDFWKTRVHLFGWHLSARGVFIPVETSRTVSCLLQRKARQRIPRESGDNVSGWNLHFRLSAVYLRLYLMLSASCFSIRFGFPQHVSMCFLTTRTTW